MLLSEIFNELFENNKHSVLEKWTKYLNDTGCNININDWSVNILSDKIIQILPNPYKKLTVKILSIVFDNATVKFEPDEEKLLRDNGFEELFPSQAPASAVATTQTSNPFDALLAKIYQTINGAKLSGKELDIVIQSEIPIDTIPVPVNTGYDANELNSIVRTTDYPEFEKDGNGKTRNKDGIIKCAIAKYGEEKVYRYSNFLRFIGASLRMADTTSATTV